MADRSRLLGKREEAFLGGILGALAVAQHARAGAEHHAAVPTDQLREGLGIALTGVAGEEHDIIHDR